MDLHTSDRTNRPAQKNLLEQINAHFSLNELRELCFELGIDPDVLNGGRKGSFLIDLLRYCQQHGLMVELVKLVQKKRPFLDLPSQVNQIELGIPASPFWQRPIFFVPISILILFAILSTLLVNFGGPNYIADQINLLAPRPISTAQPNEVLIIITTFVRYEGVDDARVQSELARAIQDASQKLDFLDIRVEVAPDELSSSELELAGDIGEKYDASFIVFGDQTSVRINAYFLNLKLSTNRTSLGEEITYPLVNDEGYKLTTQLPAQVVYKLFFDVAETYFQNGKYDEAIKIASNAISYSYSELSSKELGTGYFFIGKIYEQQQNEIQTERYFCSSRSHYPLLTSGMQLECVFPKRSQ